MSPVFHTTFQRVLPIGGFLALAILLFATMSDYGLSWDEPTRWRSGDTKLDYYQELLSSGDVWRTMQEAPKDVYPGLYDIPLALARRAPGADPILLSRIANVLFGLLAVFATFSFTRLLCAARAEDGQPHSQGIAYWTPFVAVAILLSFAEFYGHIFINPKDIPFAATYMLGLYAIGRFVVALPKPKLRDTLFCGLAIGACMAARPPGVALLGYVGVATLAWLVVAGEKGSRRTDVCRLLAHGLGMGALALVTLMIFWPAAHQNPFGSSVEAVGALRTFSQEIPVVFGGQVYSASDTPIYYVLWMFLIKAPLYVVALLALSICVAFGNLRSGKAFREKGPHQSLLVWLALLAILFPVAYVLARQPAIHNGFRHMLYVLPPLSSLLALYFTDWANSLARPIARRCAWAGLAIAVGLAAVTHFRLHPYQYVYYNALAGGTSGSLSQYETEYWFTSSRDALSLLSRHMSELGQEEATVMITGPWQVAQPYLTAKMRLVGTPSKADYFIGNTQMRADLLVEGREIGRIERAGLPIVFVKSLRQ